MKEAQPGQPQMTSNFPCPGLTLIIGKGTTGHGPPGKRMGLPQGDD